MKVKMIATIIMVLLALTVAGCAIAPGANTVPEVIQSVGQVEPLQLKTTLWIANNAIQSVRGFETWYHEASKTYAFIGQTAGGWGWVFMSENNIIVEACQNVAATPCGQVANSQTVTQLVDAMKNGGWTKITAATVPIVLKDTIGTLWNLFKITVPNTTYSITPVLMWVVSPGALLGGDAFGGGGAVMCDTPDGVCP